MTTHCKKSDQDHQAFKGTQPDFDLGEHHPSSGKTFSMSSIKVNRKAWKSGELAPKPVEVVSEAVAIAEVVIESVESASEDVEDIFEPIEDDEPVESISNTSPRSALIGSIEWVESFDSSSEDVPGELIKVAKSLELGQVCIPCYAKLETGQKPPVKEVALTWKTEQYTPLELAQFPSMEILSVRLGKEFAVQDIDGLSALNRLTGLVETLSPETREAVENTLWTSSDRQTRFGIWWRVPEKYQGVLQFKSTPTGDQEQLEFRTGDHYQAVAGIHPGSGMYWSNGVSTIAEMPEELCELWLGVQGSDRKSSKAYEEPKKAVEINTTDFQLAVVQQLLGFLETLESDEIDTDDYHLWLRVGMIIHSVDESEKGLQIWDEWSQKSPKYEPGTCEKKWASFDSEGDKLSIGTLYFWLQKESEKIADPVKRSEFQGGIEKIKENFSKKWTIESTPRAIAEFKESGLEGQSLDLAMQRLAVDAYGSASEYNLNRLWDLYTQEEISEEEKQSAQNLIERFRVLQNFKLDVLDIVGDTTLGQTIHEAAIAQNLDPAYMLQSFLTAYSSVLPKRTKYQVNHAKLTPPHLYTLFIAVASDGKDTYTEPFTKPLEDLTIIERNTYTKALEEWKKKLEIWKKKKPDVQREEYKLAIGSVARDIDEDISEVDMQEICCPEPTPAQIRAIVEFTPERARSLSGEQTDFGILACPSEFKEMAVKGAKHSKNGGSTTDMTWALANYDGRSTLTDLQGDKERKADYWQVGILSAIQPDVFKGLFNPEKDSDGLISRSTILDLDQGVEFSVNEDPDNLEFFDFQPLLLECYKETQEIFQPPAQGSPDIVYKPTKEAKSLWNDFHRECFDLARPLRETVQGAYSWFRRHPVRVARIAFTLHCFLIQQGVIEKSDRVSDETMAKAIKIGHWQIAKYLKLVPRAVFSESNNPDRNLIEFYNELLNKLQRSQGYELGQEIALRSIRDNFRNQSMLERFGSKGQKRLDEAGLNKCLNALRDLGLIEYRPKGKSTLVKLIK
ncbi:MAG: DUF3987 domain-containing protein [Leptolyngbya sp. UWPOB_LEPTO1]|uniref:DUF3987 domain-containing protein n=1 Tax=Leptolyngbya sp. UWPOB_LEPTO1 TaxID=2815653 RepID=UPI001AC12351|nr:DUF3987 domain-containing protein [Leptolyngbya sp. UWPOB_LEPTO1]MBN8564126.1 DUF3987 domain-containing protein [Leptolyngbya sp. UWPOB_LEPTO1]